MSGRDPVRGRLARGICALLLVAAASACAAAVEPDAGTARYRAIFTAELAKLRAADVSAKAKWAQDYVSALRGLRTELQRGGQLAGVLAVDAEARRFQSTPTLPAESFVGEPLALRNVQETYATQRGDLERSRYQRVLQLKDLYVARLESVVSDLTRADEIDRALVVNTEIARAKQEPDVTAAEFAMAAATTSEPPPEETGIPAATGTTPTVKPDVKPLPPGVTIAAADVALAEPAHYALREATITGGPSGGVCRFRAWVGKRSLPTDERQRADVARILIAAQDRGQSLVGFALHVTSFGKKKPAKFAFGDRGQLSDRLDARRGYEKVGDGTIPLPAISNGGVVVDLFGMSSLADDGDELMISDAALDFAGVVIELLDDKGQGVFLGATLRDLLKEADQ